MFYNLKRIRESHDLTQRELANILKISKSSYNNFETGTQIIPLKHLNNFCQYFQVSMDFVCGLSNIGQKENKVVRLNKRIIGYRIKKIRLKKQLTQEQLASILNTSQSNISSYENGKTLILTAFAYTIAKELKVSLDYLTGRSDNIKIIRKKKRIKVIKR